MIFKKTIKVGGTTTIVLPKKICEQVNLQPYDDCAIFVDTENRIIIKKFTEADFNKSMFDNLGTIDI